MGDQEMFTLFLIFHLSSGEPVLWPPKARPLGVHRTEPGCLKIHDAGFSSGSESRDQLGLSPSTWTQPSSEYIHPVQYLPLYCQIHHFLDRISYKSMNQLSLSCLSHTALFIYWSTIKYCHFKLLSMCTCKQITWLSSIIQLLPTFASLCAACMI